MLHLYDDAHGVAVPAWSLSSSEALSLFDRGVLEARDFALLTSEVQQAVRARIEHVCGATFVGVVRRGRFVPALVQGVAS